MFPQNHCEERSFPLEEVQLLAASASVGWKFVQIILDAAEEPTTSIRLEGTSCSRFIFAASALTRLFSLFIHLLWAPLKVFWEQMLYVCGSDGPSEAKMASCFDHNQNDGS
ncbi:hypothetical protein CRENBAI_013136 [Crenichthys baileyi]|uniref:Uncharacterized protein n=1 Tax=Crenichthys baileyi TaxID=28760 RepID=A0AAV9S508_9TELE